MNELVLNQVNDEVCQITLNRPDRLNAINRELVSAFRESLINANADESVTVIIIRGAGDAFCSGNDLKDTASREEDLRDVADLRRATGELQDVTRQIVGSDKIVIAAVQGWAVGAGFEWVINCDFSIWARSAKAFFPEVGWGLSATGGVLTLLPRIVGMAKAREMLLLGDKYGAEELHALGIAYKVVDESSLDDAALQLAKRIIKLPKTTVGRFKRSFSHAAFATDFDQTLAIETDALVEALTDAGLLDKVRRFQSD